MAWVVVAQQRIHSISSDKQIMQNHWGVNAGITIFHSDWLSCNFAISLRSFRGGRLRKKIIEPKHRYLPISLQLFPSSNHRHNRRHNTGSLKWLQLLCVKAGKKPVLCAPCSWKWLLRFSLASPLTLHDSTFCHSLPFWLKERKKETLFLNTEIIY